MRVLHIGKFYPPYPGGIENFNAALARTQARDGLPSAVLAHAAPGTHRSSRDLQDGVEVVRVACHGQFVYAPLSPAFPWQLARILRRFRPDILHLHLPNTSAFWALLSPAARRLPWVVHWHADVPLDAARYALRLAYRVYRPWEQAVLRRAQCIIATSQAYLQTSSALTPWRNKVAVIPLGLDDAAVSTQPCRWPDSSNDALRVLAVGRLAYYKGHDVLLRALAQTPQAVLLLVGSGEREQALRQLAAELGVSTRVRFAGAIDDAELAAAYASAHVFCLPSIERSEAFGLVLLEAMRAGLPVIASAITGSGVGHVVRDGATGVLTASGNADALAAALKQLHDDPELRQQMGAAGRERWQQEFSMDAVNAQIRQLYQGVLAQR